MGRSQEIERCATRVIALSNAPWHSVPDMEDARYEANRALAAALALPPEAAAPVALRFRQHPYPAQGDRVRVTRLGDTTGFLIHARPMLCRKAGVFGVVANYVAGHGGDVYFVTHDDGQVGAYVYDELEPIELAPYTTPVPPPSEGG